LGKTPSTARYYADNGRLPFVRTLDGVRLFRLDDVLRLKAEIERGERAARDADALVGASG
jgi:hypothetical protein